MKFEKINISEITCEELRKLGSKNQPFESIISEILNHVKSCGRFWERRN